jgi:hypothetical protein
VGENYPPCHWLHREKRSAIYSSPVDRLLPRPSPIFPVMPPPPGSNSSAAPYFTCAAAGWIAGKMDGKGDPLPRAASEVPDIATQAHAVQLQLMAMSSRPTAGNGVHGGPSRGSILGLGGGGRGSARGTGRQGRGRGRAQGGNTSQGNGPPLGSRHDAVGQGDGVQHAAAGHKPIVSPTASYNSTCVLLNTIH